MALHEWVFELEAWRRPHGREGGEVNASSEVFEEATANVGAILMGRNMFGGGPGPWGEDPWNGWWGEEPPFHVPVFVLTHHEREPLEMDGETTFHFVTDGIEAALEQASAAAGGEGRRDRRRRRRRSSSTSPPASSTRCGSTSCRSCSAPASRLFDETTAGAGLSSRCGAVEAPGVTHLHYRRAG